MRFLFWLMMVFALVSCAGGDYVEGGENSVSKTEQALPSYCSTPAYAHIIGGTVSVKAIPPGASCPAAYYPSEPQVWSISPAVGTPPPQRGDGKCSCKWSSPGLCYNQITNGPYADYECYAGACYYYRSFECGYRAAGKPANDCSWKVTYTMNDVQAVSANGSWTHTDMWLVAKEPGCQRNIHVSDFHTILPF